MNQIKWSGHSLIVLACGANQFGLIVSKFGIGSQARGHRFDQWRSRAEQPGTADAGNHAASESG